MKILIVTPYFYPSVGGVQNYALSIARGLKKDYGHNIVIVTTGNKSGKIIKQNFEGMVVYRLPYQFKLSNTPINLHWKKKIQDIIKAEKPDVINAHTPVPYLADMAARAADRIPFVLTYHNDLAKPDLVGKLLAKAYYIIFGRNTMRYSDMIITTSEYYISISPYLNKYKDKIAVVSPGVDLNKYNNYVDKTWLKKKYPNKKIILFVGTLDRNHLHKGVDVLLKAAAQVRKHVPDTELLIAGTGNATMMYRKLAQELGIQGNTDFLGFVSELDLPKYYAGSDVFVLPSSNASEGFGMVLAEAQACGTIVIGSKAGGIPYVVQDNKTGYLFETNNINELAETIQKALAQQSSVIVENAYNKVHQYFDWGISCATSNKFLEEIVNSDTKIEVVE